MELKSPKAKKKTSFAKLLSRSKMLRAPLLMLFLLGSTSCDDHENDSSDIAFAPKNDSIFKSSEQFLNHDRVRHKHTLRIQPNFTASEREMLSDIKYLRRHLNKEIVNFVMTDFLVDGEIEHRIHYNGITAKETAVGVDGNGLKLRQLTDSRHLVQLIYAPNGEIQDCEFITQSKSARNFLKTLRKELKLALDEEIIRLSETQTSDIEEEKFYRHFRNSTVRLLKNGERLPADVAEWLNYDELKMECLRQHQEVTSILENRSGLEKSTLSRSRRSIRANFILPGTKWCGAGQLAESYAELGPDRKEDRCCRSHDNCKLNILPFRRRFGEFNFRPYTISHCRFRACLKLADTSVSNMVGKLFFNVVQTKCFVLKRVKVCTQRSWWGKCLRRGFTKQAYLRDNMPY
ncbi:hypothetical protein ACJJTC_002584 [Scirpophaga incertulas]